MARIVHRRHKSLLQSLALFTVALLLSSCGGTKENLGPPSIPQNLKYEFTQDGIKLFWNEPENNFNFKYDEVSTDDLTTKEFDSGINPQNYFKIDKLERAVYQSDYEKNYEFFIPIREFYLYDNPKGSFSIVLRAYNNPLESNINQSTPAVALLKSPSTQSPPQFKSELITDDSKSNHNDYFINSDSWVSASNYFKWIEFCDFIEIDWNRTETIKIETSGSFKSRSVFTLNDYLKGAEQSKEGCLSAKTPKANRGALKYKITLTNGSGSTSLTGEYNIFNPWPEKNGSKKNEPVKTYVPERWNNITPENERAAKTVWCIENGYRDYDLKTNRCIY